jgi:hypothetical protein
MATPMKSITLIMGSILMGLFSPYCALAQSNDPSEVTLYPQFLRVMRTLVPGLRGGRALKIQVEARGEKTVTILGDPSEATNRGRPMAV